MDDRARPLAYFITFSVHGTWLHGDARGSVDRYTNAPGSPFVPANPIREATTRDRLRHGNVVLDAEMRECVREAIEGIFAVRGWTLLAINVRTNHVHLVGTAAVRPEVVMRAAKLWATRRLRERQLLAADVPVWTRHGSTRYLWKVAEVDRVCNYVLHGQGTDIPGSVPAWKADGPWSRVREDFQ